MGFSPGKILLTASQLTKRFGPVAAVKAVDFQIDRGDFVSIFGPNGAGKTTLLQLLANLSSPTEGAIRWFSSRTGNDRCSIGYVSHQSLLYSELSGLENLLFFSHLYQVAVPQQRAGALLEQMGLQKAGHRLVKHYSSGMKQRLTLARALIHEPELLLLDEPYAGLDQHGSRLLTTVLNGYIRENRTVLLVTHNLLEGLALSSRVLIMNHGEVVYQAGRADMEFTDFEKMYFGLVEG